MESRQQHNKGLSIDTPLTDPNFDRKLDDITAGAPPHLREHLLTRISRENCQTIINYILAMQTEVVPTDSYRIGTIHTLKRFAKFHKPKKKTFQEIERQNIIDFLDSFRKPESLDTLHKWVGTYEFCRIILMRFFKWLYAPDLPQRKRPKPAVMDNIPKLKRKEISIYKPTDLWTEEDDALFFQILSFFKG